MLAPRVGELRLQNRDLLRPLRRAATTAPALLPRISTSQLAQRGLCVNLRQREGGKDDAWAVKKDREALEKLKASLAKKKKPIDEADEKVRARMCVSLRAADRNFACCRFDCRTSSSRSACASRSERS